MTGATLPSISGYSISAGQLVSSPEWGVNITGINNLTTDTI